MSPLTSIDGAGWLPALAGLVSALSLIIALLALIAIKRLRKTVEALRRVEANALKQRQLMQESLQGLGRQILQQGERMLRQGQPESSSAPPSDDSQRVLSMLNAGRSIEEIASDTGLEEVEVALLQQIHDLRQQSATQDE